MTQRKRNPSFDSMIKFFLKHYNIATKQDISRLAEKIESLEKSIQKMPAAQKSSTAQEKAKSASDVVLNIIKNIGGGASFSDIKARTDFDDKKLRNIIYRLNKQGKIRRKKRGTYVAE
ncbi:MAG: hypothetical protein K9J79_12315 [Desulfobacteraceae bacterium]|nr:hypothetical protein [Desulfobacteraceae bacterium]MCF8096131.1 hypothetical protein [Desulfobacteraceae bacterium]